MTNQQVFNIAAGDPNGYIQAQKPAICYTDAGGFWVKTNDVLDNTGWTSLISDVVTP